MGKDEGPLANHARQRKHAFNPSPRQSFSPTQPPPVPHPASHLLAPQAIHLFCWPYFVPHNVDALVYFPLRPAGRVHGEMPQQDQGGRQDAAGNHVSDGVWEAKQKEK